MWDLLYKAARAKLKKSSKEVTKGTKARLATMRSRNVWVRRQPKTLNIGSARQFWKGKSSTGPQMEILYF